MNYHELTAAEALGKLESKPEGITPGEAEERLKKFGSNELTKEERTGPLAMFFNQFKNILIIILLIATGLSVAVGEVVDAAIIAVIVVFSAALGFIQEYRAERALEALKKMLGANITVLRGDREEEVDVRLLVPGDIMLLEAGDKVPVDGRVIHSASLQCDEASLTGESLPVEKTIDTVKGTPPLGDRRNMVYTGSVVTYGRATVLVTATGMKTEFGKIAQEVTSVKADKTPLEKRTEEIGKWLGLGALGICVLVIGVSLLRESNAGTLNMNSFVIMLMFGVALAVAAVPEALAAIVTGALAIGMREMAKRNALIRKMPAVETLGCTTVICTDKTGTLTRGEMTVRRVYAFGRFVEVSGAGYEPVGEFSDGGETPKDELTTDLTQLFNTAVLCNDSHLGKREDGQWAIKGDPTEAALIVMAAKAGYEHDGVGKVLPRVHEVPFSSERKLMSTVNKMKDGSLTAFVKGAPEEILVRLTHIPEPDGKVRPITEADRAALRLANEQMAMSALRVLGLAYKPMAAGDSLEAANIESGLVFAGLAGIMDPPRPEATEAVAVCKRVHMRPVMITGDHKLTAVAIAKEMGIFNEGDMVLTGQELEAMSDAEFEAVVAKVSVYARVSPMDKLKIVSAWKKRGEVVAMTGDGVNDAPALKHADIGIAMGSGTEVAKEAADMVLNDDNFATIVAAIERGRWIYDNIKKYLTYLLRCNVTEVLVIGGVVLVMGPEYLPLLPAAILYVNMATDGLPALALGVAPPDPDIMQRPPRKPGESVFSREVLTFILMAVIIEMPIFLYMFFGSLPDMELARTRMFFMFIIMELVIAMNFRSMRYSILKAKPHFWLLMAIFWELVLIAGLMCIPAVREAFGIGVPSLFDMVEIAGFGLGVMVLMEIVKYYVRRRGAAEEAVAPSA